MYKGHMENRMLLAVWLFIIACSMIVALQDGSIFVPNGANIVLESTTTGTWWKQIDGKDMLLNFGANSARINSFGYLYINVTNIEQAGTYKYKIITKDAARTEEFTFHVNLTFADVITEKMSCLLLGTETTIPCDKSCFSEIGIDTGITKGHHNCTAPNSGEHLEVIRKGTEVELRPSSTAIWRSTSGEYDGFVNFEDDICWVDNYGRLRLHIHNKTDPTVYTMKIYRNIDPIEFEVKTFLKIVLDENVTIDQETTLWQPSQNITLTCQLHLNSGNKTVAWYRDGRREVISKGPTVEITNISQSETGLYICFIGSSGIGQIFQININSIEDSQTTEDPSLYETKASSITAGIAVAVTILVLGLCMTGIIYCICKVYRQKQQYGEVSTSDLNDSNTTEESPVDHHGNTSDSQLTGDSTSEPYCDNTAGNSTATDDSRELGVSTSGLYPVNTAGSSHSDIESSEHGVGPSTANDDSSGDARAEISAQMEELADELRCQYQEKLPLWYKAVLSLSAPDGQPIYISPVLWLDKADKDCFDKPPPDKTDILSVLRNMKSGSRVLIAADAGHGKSALLNYLCRLWVNKHPDMHRYKLVLYGLLRYVKHGEMKHALCKDLRILTSGMYSTLKNILKSKLSEKILWLIDSYEELNPDFYSSELDELLKGKKHSDTSVIVTTRPHCNQQLYDGADVSDVRANANGKCLLLMQKFSDEDRLSYLQSVEESLKKMKHASKIDNLKSILSHIPKELLSVPLFLALICSLWHNEKTTSTTVNTNTKLLNVLLKKSIQDSSKKRRNKTVSWPKFNTCPLEPTVDKETKANLKILGEACFSAIKCGRRYLSPCDLEAFSIEISKVGEMGIGDLIDGMAHDQVTFPHSLMQEYLAAVFLLSSDLARDKLLQEITERMKEPEMTLDIACGEYWQVILFAIGMTPFTANTAIYTRVNEGASVNTPGVYHGSFLTQLSASAIHSIPVYKDKVTGYLYIPLSCERRLYNECSSDNECQQFVSHLALCNLVHADMRPPHSIEQPFPLLTRLQINSVIVTWAEKLDLCKKETGKVTLFGTQCQKTEPGEATKFETEVRLQGAVMGSLLDAVDIIDVGYLFVSCCIVNLKNLSKATEKLSELFMEGCEVMVPSTDVKYTQIEAVELRTCHNYKKEEVSAFFPKAIVHETPEENT